jgi:voltage-gated potassium channel
VLIVPTVISFLAIGQFARLIRYALADPMARTVLLAVGVMLAVGTVFYRLVEGWGLLDSLYFSVVTLLTIGFGDFVPETAAGKIFTIVYSFAGVGVFAIAASTIVQRSPRWIQAQEAEKKREAEDGTADQGE